MNIAWALLLSLLILILLSIGFFIFLRASLFGSQLFFKVFKKYPQYIILFIFLNLALIIYSVFNPWYLPLTIFVVYIGSVKLYEYIDDRFLDDKIGGWIVSQEKLLFKVIPNPYSNTAVSDMEKFLLLMHSMYGSRNQKDFRSSGKFYDEFKIELIAKGGITTLYIQIFKQNLQTFLSAARMHFPRVRFEQIEGNEVDYLPENFYEANKIWKQLDFGEFKYLSSDLYPIKNHLQLAPNSPEYSVNPITQLFDYFKIVEDEDMVVLQFCIRPMDVTVDGKLNKWKGELSKLRQEFMTNSSTGVTADGRITPLTPNEVAILTNCENKINTQNYQVKLKFGYFGKKITAKRYMGGIMSYFKQFATEKQAIIPKIKSWDESGNATWGKFWDDLYWTPETLKRCVDFYDGLIKRNWDRGGDAEMWDIKSLSSLIQIPSVFFETKDFIHPTLNLAKNSIKYLQGLGVVDTSSENTQEINFKKNTDN
jgi:hypothetical protein